LYGTCIENRLDDPGIARQAIQWELRGYKKKPGRLKENWTDIVKRDLKAGIKKPKKWRQTEQDGVNVMWPNASARNGSGLN